MIIAGTIIVTMFGGFGPQLQTQTVVSMSPSSRVICTDGLCSAEIHTTDVFFHNRTSDIWEDINESMYACDLDFCSQNYRLSMRVFSNGSVFVKAETNEVTIKLIDMLGIRTHFDNTTLTENSVTFNNVFTDIDVRYTYMSTKMKEDIIVRSNRGLMPNGPFNITYSISGNAINFEPVIVCDAANNCTRFPVVYNRTNVMIQANGRYFNAPNRVYPVVIDPLIFLNGTNNTWDGFVTANTLGQHNRTSSAIVINVGVDTLAGALLANNTGAIEWNITSLPKNANITDVRVQLRKAIINNNGGNSNITFHSMEQQNKSYIQDEAGDTLFMEDMTNGTMLGGWLNMSVSAALNYTLNQRGIQDFQNRLNLDGWWAHGIVGWGDPAVLTKSSMQLASSENGAVIARPILYVLFTVGDWNISCADNITISQPVDVSNSSVNIIGNGTFTITKDITNFRGVHIQGSSTTNKCYVTCKGGCFL